jgi:hypothetical protein
MAQNGLDDQGLLQYYLDNLLAGLPSNRNPVFWEEVFDEGAFI